jgi:hypothetical protein
VAEGELEPELEEHGEGVSVTNIVIKWKYIVVNRRISGLIGCN